MPDRTLQVGQGIVSVLFSLLWEEQRLELRPVECQAVLHEGLPFGLAPQAQHAAGIDQAVLRVQQGKIEVQESGKTGLQVWEGDPEGRITSGDDRAFRRVQGYRVC